MTHPEPRLLTGLPRVPRDTQVGEHVLNTLAGDHPLTVLRGPRGYGKTSAIVTWLREDAPDREVVYFALTTESNEFEGFWAEVRAAFAKVGMIDAASADLDDRQAVLHALAERARPLCVVIDDYHEAGLKRGAVTIDDELVDLVRQNDQLFLVIASRTLRALETTGALSVDAAVIGPAELRMTATMVHALAQRLGVNLTMDQAQQITVDLGGWPSAIRAGLVQSAYNHADPGEIDGSLVDGWIATMVRDLRFENVRSFLLRTAIPDQFDIETARVIAPEGNTVRILRNVRAAGLLSERHTVDGQVYSYAPAIRSALIRVMKETRPELLREVHLALMRIAAADHDPGQVLTHAVHAAEWSTALDVIERQWARLLTVQPLVLISAARMFPPEIAARSARLRVAMEYLEGALDPRGGRVEGGSPWPVGDYPSINAAITANRSSDMEPEDDETLVLLQWGISSLLSGDLDTSTYAFSRARARGLVDVTDSSAVQMGTIGLAMVHALQGEPEMALKWLDDPAARERLDRTEPEDARDITVVAASIARALAAVDAGRADAADAVAGMIEPRQRDELWALSVFIRAHHVVVDGSPEQIFRQTNHLRAALRHISRGSLVEAIITSTLVELLVVANMTGVAREVADRFDGNPVAWAAMAKLQLADRSFADAIAYATKAADAAGLSRRAAMECDVVLSSAHHALGNLTEARRAFNHAVRHALATGQRRPFFLMQRYVFDTLAGDDPAIAGLWPGTARTSTPEPQPVLDEMPTLTMREAQVLRALEVHAGPVGIAHDLGLSVNTVKTHLRTIYKKFGVKNRNEALAVAERGLRTD